VCVVSPGSVATVESDNSQRTTTNCVNENIGIKKTRAMHMNYYRIWEMSWEMTKQINFKLRCSK